MLQFYFAPGSSSMAPHIALFETGAAFESRPVSFGRKEQLGAAYLRINPEGKVPCLVVDGRPLSEVAAILYYLARRFPAARLWPEGNLEAEAQAISWLSFIASTLHPARSKGVEQVRKAWRQAEQRLGARDWANGDYSICDIHLFRLYWRVRPTLVDELAAFPHLEAHYARMMARPAVQQTIAVETAVGYELPN